jgi:DNA-directed RNA polymerase subunit RPC12/RpoP
MKFLCIACDQAMRLSGTAGPDEGSLTVTFACPSCGHRVAMLTNPWETQMVRTLGVKVGGAPAEAPVPFAAVRATLAHQRDTGTAPAMSAPTAEGLAAPVAAGAPAAEGPGCPFAAMIGGTSASGASPVAWTVDAAGRLERIPTFIRPMARQAIERFAQERGYATVTDEVMDQARDFMGM